VTGATSDEESLFARTLSKTQWIAGIQVVTILVLTGISGQIHLPAIGRIAFLAPPIALLGLVAPVIGFRLWLWMLEQVPRDAAPRQRCDRFLRATVTALSVTEVAAVLGLVAWVASGQPFALAGVLTHVLLAGAIWPRRERLEQH
jgi:hypothetical protein